MGERSGAASILAVILAACAGPPTGVAVTDAGARADAVRPIEAPPGADAAAAPDPDATAADAAHPDLDGVDAGPPVDPLNPGRIHFENVTGSAWDTTYLGGRVTNDVWAAGAGAAIGDVNGDGRLDLVLARIDDPTSTFPGGPPELLLNEGPGAVFAHFAPDPAFRALLAGARTHAAALGDYDRDGDLDLFLGANGADHLLENDGAGQFVDVTPFAGVAGIADDVTVGAIWVDVNHDGLLDLYLAQNATTVPAIPSEQTRNRLYLNVADGTFVDVTDAAHADSGGSSHAVAAFDLGGSGNLDLYVANDGVPTDAWYRLVSIDEQGVPLYEDRAADLGVATVRASMGIAIDDVDGDLTPDLYISNWGENPLYVNPSPGSPVVSATAWFGVGAHHHLSGWLTISWGVRFVDLDRDGALELYIANGGVTEIRTCVDHHQLDWFLRQGVRGGRFDVITGKVGFPESPVCGSPSPTTISRGAIFGDLDLDGDQDLVVTPFIESYRAYRNDTPAGSHAVQVRLVGTVSSPDPVGATLLVTRYDGAELARFRYAGGDTYSQSDSLLEVGLGSATGVADARVLWPSGFVQRVSGMPGFAVDSVMTIVEPNWLDVSPRVVDAGDPPAQLVYRPVDDLGIPLGPAGAGRAVSVVRSDGIACAVTDAGDGTYVADLPHPGVARRTVLSVTVDGVVLRPRPMINFR